MWYSLFLRETHYFNPRSREGSDSTRVLKCQAYFYFNPRSREGSDPSIEVERQNVDISIHAPAKGATRRLL